MESDMAEVGSCLSTKVARDGEMPIQGTPAASRCGTRAAGSLRSRGWLETRLRF